MHRHKPTEAKTVAHTTEKRGFVLKIRTSTALVTQQVSVSYSKLYREHDSSSKLPYSFFNLFSHFSTQDRLKATQNQGNRVSSTASGAQNILCCFQVKQIVLEKIQLRNYSQGFCLQGLKANVFKLVSLTARAGNPSLKNGNCLTQSRNCRSNSFMGKKPHTHIRRFVSKLQEFTSS